MLFSTCFKKYLWIFLFSLKINDTYFFSLTFQNDLDNLKFPNITFEELEAKFFTQAELALSVALKLLPLGIKGGNYLYKKIVRKIAAENVSNLISTNFDGSENTAIALSYSTSYK